MSIKTFTRFDDPENGLSVIGLIGSGTFGNTYLCKSEGNFFVLKVAKNDKMETAEKFKTEGLNLRNFESNVYLKVIAISGVDDGFDLSAGEMPFLITDYIPGISLHELLEALRIGDGHHSTNFKKINKYKIIYGIVKGLALLHKHGVTHRDIKPGNIFIDQDFNPHIGDFGELSDHELTKVIHGTNCFLPPEAYQEDGHKIPCGPPYDVYEFGCTLFQIITYEWPFNDQPVKDVLTEFTSKGKRDDRIEQGKIGILEEDEPLYQIVKMCWNQDPGERPTMAEVSQWILEAAPDIFGDEFEEFKEYADSIGGESTQVGTYENVLKAIKNGFAEHSKQLREIAKSENIEEGKFGDTIGNISDGRIRPPTLSKRADSSSSD